MLSPASLRVCCLAVMAPALTKADRRADCLPVVLPFPADPENRKDKINDFTLAKFPNKFTCLFNKRKHLMHKAWLRTYMRNNSELSDKNRYSQFDLRKSLLNSKVRINADSKNKSWHGTNVTVAVADKVRLKYTMNKNNSSLRNMGLARTNTSLGLHSMKRMNRFAHLSHRDKGNPSNSMHESGESSPDLPDSANSDLEAPYRIVRIVQPVKGQTTEKVSCGDLKCDTIPFVDNITLSPVDKLSSDFVSDSTKIPLSSMSPSDSAVALNDSNLCVALTDSKCSIQASESLGTVRSPIQESSNEFPPESCNISVRAGSNDMTVIQGESSQSNPVATLISDFKESELQDSVDCLNSVSPLPSPFCDVSTQDDITDITASLDPEASSFSVASPISPASHHSLIGSDVETGSITSSTLSADASPIPSSVDEGNEKLFITFPDSFLASASGVHKELVAPAFSDALCLTLNNSDSAGSDDEMHVMRKTCCPLAEKDLSNFQELVKEHERKITVALNETEALLRKYAIQHIYNEIRTLIQHIQRKLSIPCQRLAKLSGSKPRDVLDKKAELLQNENVKNLSTAALVSLVRKLESSNSGNILPHQSVALPDSELSRNKLTSTFSPEDCADVQRTSKVLLNGVKRLLHSADPDLTESSDDGNSDTEMDEPIETSAQKKALWKFMMERAALASRSTLLVAKIRELENQLRNVTNYLKKVSASYGDISFEEPPASASSALSTESAGDASLQTSVKLNRPKVWGRPVNGYLDHSSMNSAIHSGITPGGSETLLLEKKLNNSFSVMDTSESCSRTRALKTSNFHKRKLLVTTGLHLTNSKLAKLSTVSCVCNCQDDMPPCVLCTGRYNCIQSVDPDSLPLLDRVSLLDPNFHPLLSLEKDIPLLVHFENILKKNEAQYQSVRPVSPIPSHRRLGFGTKPKHLTDAKSRNHNLKRYARSLLSAKYRNKKKHFRKHKLVFGKWRKLHNKSSFHSRDRFRRFSVASSGSSHDSPVPSPMSAYDDGSGYDARRRRDDNQFDIDDVIIPYSNKRGRLVKFEFKDIEIPSWRSIAFDDLKSIEMEEDTSDAAFIKRHEGYEVEERKIIRNGGGALCFFNTWQKRARRQHRSDSRADSSGANTPDPVLICDQDILFQDTNSMLANSPLSPALSPPTTPSSANIISDDSQPPLSHVKKKISGAKRQDESTAKANTTDYDEILPYEQRSFPLSEGVVEELLAESDHNRDDTDVTASGPSCPASPASTTSSTSTVEEEDVTDPEWRVVKRESGPEQALVLKFAKR